MASGLEIAGVALAVPGVIDATIRGAESVYARIETFRKVDQTLSSYRDVTLDLKEGTLYFALQALKSASRDRNVPLNIQENLNQSLDNVDADIQRCQQLLGNVHEDTIKGKLIYTFWKGKGSKHQLDTRFNALKESCNVLKDLCLQLQNYRNSQSCHLWTSDIFKVTHETVDNRPGYLLQDSDIVVVQGNYEHSGVRTQSDFILEPKRLENDIRLLCAKLSAEQIGARQGILPVLGYRQPPYNEPDGSKVFQLIFELPPNTIRKSLAHILSSRPAPTIRERLLLSLQVALAVQSTHSLGLVHKSIRTRSLLILYDMHAPGFAPKLYLQDWTYVRETSGATAQLGQYAWQKAIYQHPERQGRYTEAVYEPRHDIYSLGVCCLEILLWRPFVIETTNLQALPIYGIYELFERHGLARGEQNGGLPERYRGDAARLASKPWATRLIWCDIASSELQDLALTQLVLNCLNGSFANIEEVVHCLEHEISVR